MHVASSQEKGCFSNCMLLNFNNISFCSQTSGLEYTSGFFAFLVPLILFKFYNSSRGNYKLISILTISPLIISSTFDNMGRVSRYLKAF